MGGDNFNKKTSESGKKPTNIADKLSTAINAGKKHRDSTPERLEKEAMNKLNALVEQFIVDYDVYSQIENAAAQGNNTLNFRLSGSSSIPISGLLAAKNMSSKILSVNDKGGSKLSVSKSISDFGRLLRKKFLPTVKIKFHESLMGNPPWSRVENILKKTGQPTGIMLKWD